MKLADEATQYSLSVWMRRWLAEVVEVAHNLASGGGSLAVNVACRLRHTSHGRLNVATLTSPACTSLNVPALLVPRLVLPVAPGPEANLPVKSGLDRKGHSNLLVLSLTWSSL